VFVISYNGAFLDFLTFYNITCLVLGDRSAAVLCVNGFCTEYILVMTQYLWQNGLFCIQFTHVYFCACSCTA